MAFEMSSIITLIGVVSLTAISVFVHYHVCRALSRTRGEHPKGHRLIGVILVFLFAHLFEVNLFAVAYFVFAQLDGFGHITNAVTYWDYVYFSGSVYTTLGIGDLTPIGSLRTFATVESLVGLTLITWSASYAYFEMSISWRDDARSASPKSD